MSMQPSRSQPARVSGRAPGPCCVPAFQVLHLPPLRRSYPAFGGGVSRLHDADAPDSAAPPTSLQPSRYPASRRYQWHSPVWANADGIRARPFQSGLAPPAGSAGGDRQP